MVIFLEKKKSIQGQRIKPQGRVNQNDIPGIFHLKNKEGLQFVYDRADDVDDDTNDNNIQRLLLVYYGTEMVPNICLHYII